MNTEDNNKMIAEFMDYTHPLLPVSVGLEYYDGDEMEYHTSWDWLMPVVQKCFDTQQPEEGQHYFINESLLTMKIEVVYDRVVEFINQYNKTK